jgi:hypothetical protein
VALARALAAVRGGAGLLILDEPTASLDVRAETELFERFLELTRGVTTILVSHRLSSVRRADRIVVIDGGRVVEDGTHDALMRAGGRYAEMFSLQAERFAVAPAPPAPWRARWPMRERWRALRLLVRTAWRTDPGARPGCCWSPSASCASPSSPGS